MKKGENMRPDPLARMVDTGLDGIGEIDYRLHEELYSDHLSDQRYLADDTGNQGLSRSPDIPDQRISR